MNNFKSEDQRKAVMANLNQTNKVNRNDIEIDISIPQQTSGNKMLASNKEHFIPGKEYLVKSGKWWDNLSTKRKEEILDAHGYNKKAFGNKNTRGFILVAHHSELTPALWGVIEKVYKEKELSHDLERKLISEREKAQKMQLKYEDTDVDQYNHYEGYEAGIVTVQRTLRDTEGGMERVIKKLKKEKERGMNEVDKGKLREDEEHENYYEGYTNGIRTGIIELQQQ